MSNTLTGELPSRAEHGELMPPVTEKKLSHNEDFEVSLALPVAPNYEVDAALGVHGALIATVKAADKSFHVVDTRDTKQYPGIFIVNGSDYVDFSKGIGCVQIPEGMPITIGRGDHADKLAYTDRISTRHFQVSHKDGTLQVRNLEPLNRTSVKARQAMPNREKPPRRPYIPLPGGVVDRRSEALEKRIQDHPDFEPGDAENPYGFFKKLPILGRLSKKVSGGVYLGGSAREAIVVDHESEALNRVYNEFIANLGHHGRRKLTPTSILTSVEKSVQSIMTYGENQVAAISRKFYNDELVGLSTYIEAGVGLCRHQGLLAAYFIENLIRDGYLHGSVGIERNTVEEMGGTHAWAIFKPEDPRLDSIVVDPAQGFTGTKAQALRKGRWRYQLSTDAY